MKYTSGPWKARRWDTINVAFYPPKQKNGMVVALAQMPGIGGPVSEKERAGNIRLIGEAPIMYEALLKAHDLSLDERHEEARELMRYAIDAVEGEKLPDNY